MKYKVTMTESSPVSGVLRIPGGPSLRFTGPGATHTVDLTDDQARHIYGFKTEVLGKAEPPRSTAETEKPKSPKNTPTSDKKEKS